MDILIPIGLGFLINLVVFVISKSLKKTNERSLVICFFVFLAVLLSSFIIGEWLGMGIGVVSLGMFVFVILVGIFTLVTRITKSV